MSGLVGLDVPAGLVDRIGTVLVQRVPPDHIVGIQRIPVKLAPRGSWAERGELAGGFAERSKSLLALPTYSLVQRKPYALVPEVL